MLNFISKNIFKTNALENFADHDNKFVKLPFGYYEFEKDTYRVVIDVRNKATLKVKPTSDDIDPYTYELEYDEDNKVYVFEVNGFFGLVTTAETDNKNEYFVKLLIHIDSVIQKDKNKVIDSLKNDNTKFQNSLAHKDGSTLIVKLKYDYEKIMYAIIILIVLLLLTLRS